MAPKSAKRRIVIDGSNIATEGRSVPNLAQLDEAIRTFLAEHPGFGPGDVTVVVDATFGHRISPSEREAFEQALEHGEMITPPAGAEGRGDGFILRIAEKSGALVLSNDSFQEFQAERPWLFEPGRLIGGKPVPGVGWVFTPRTPVRGPRSRAATAKSRGAVAAGAPANASRPARSGPAKVLKSSKPVKTDNSRVDNKAAASKVATTKTERARRPTKAAGTAKSARADEAQRPAKPEGVKKVVKVEKVTKAGGPGKRNKSTKAAKAVKAVVKAVKAAVKPTKAAKTAKPAKAVQVLKPAKATKATKAPPRAKEAARDGVRGDKSARSKAGAAAKVPAASNAAKGQAGKQKAKGSGAAKTAKLSKTGAPAKASAATKAGGNAKAPGHRGAGGGPSRDGASVAGSTALNDPMTFLTFVADHPVGSTMEGTVASFTSHGAHIAVGEMLCHIPLRGLARPAPTRARQVLTKGESRRFVLVSLDATHRRAELALPGIAR